MNQAGVSVLFGALFVTALARHGLAQSATGAPPPALPQAAPTSSDSASVPAEPAPAPPPDENRATTVAPGETLAEPETGEPPTPAPAASPASPGVVVVLGPSEHRVQRPVRAERRLALTGELGWNTLAGFGPNIAFHAHPHFTIEMGGGLSLEGWKLGLRTRVNLLKAPVTPFFGVGAMMTTGLGQTLDISDTATGRTLNVRVLPSPYLQVISGIDWTSRGGFTMIGGLGYAFLLRDDNVEIVAGEPTRDERRALNIAFRSGIVISLAIGYTFK